MSYAPKPAELRANSLTVSYLPGGPRVLEGFTLTVRPGAFVGIIGPNGSGKSTLLHALSRTLRPARGTVLLDGSDLYADLTARNAAQRIGVMPQETAVSLDFTVREVVRMGRAPHLPRRPFVSETAADERVVTEALAAVGLTEFAERLLPTLSGGERQRVLLARALAQQPDILLLDEPTSHLDLRHQSETLALAHSLAHPKTKTQGKAVLAVLHDVNLAAAWCDEIVLLSEGQIAAQGTPAEALTAETLWQVYHTHVQVQNAPATGRPLLVPLPERLPPPGPEAFHIHVICGGGTGAALLPELRTAGYRVTVAALSGNDPDAETCALLDIPFARIAPFSTPDAAALAENAALAHRADVSVVACVPFGPANLANLQAALTLGQSGTPVYRLGLPGQPFAARDFTGGEAARLWHALDTLGAADVPDTNALLKRLQGAEPPWRH